MSQLSTVPLPDNLYWSDEYQWSQVAQAQARTLDGALVVEEVALQGGRPVTLQGLWLTRTEVEQLRVLEGQVSQPMNLTLPDGRQLSVLWRREGGRPCLEAQPLHPRAAPDGETLYRVTLRMMEA